jgi:mannosyltransferase OCH1-like enzyme
MTYDDITKDPRWAIARESWISNNPDWQLMEWSPENNSQFVSEYYPWFLSTYEGFDKKVKKFDAMRYMYLHHFGGVYTDMDVTATKPIDEFTSNTSMIFVNVGGLFNNWFIASTPGASFWLEILKRISSVEQLQKNLFAAEMSDANRAEYDTYDNVICTTGSFMLSSVWEKAFNGSIRESGSNHGLRYRIYGDLEARNIMGISHAFSAMWASDPALLGLRSVVVHKGIQQCDIVKPGWKKIVEEHFES